jgi:hypothetical protein
MGYAPASYYFTPLCIPVYLCPDQPVSLASLCLFYLVIFQLLIGLLRLTAHLNSIRIYT